LLSLSSFGSITAMRERRDTFHFRSAFTLLELLVTIAIIAVLISLILAALTTAKSHGLRTQCLSNNRQLILAWTMYAHDNDGNIPRNVNVIQNYGVWTNWVAGNMTRAADQTNAALLVNPRESMIANYIDTPKVFKCPGDKSRFVRSFAMNHRMNPSNDEEVPVFTEGLGTNWMLFRKVDDIRTPSDIFVTIDERSDSINDAYFVVDVTNTGSPDGTGPVNPYFIVDYPANYHAGATLSFADGHSEIHKWVEPTTMPPMGKAYPRIHTTSTDRDMKWLQEHATHRKN
jgi:prepilin-type N-terminal cleavage/methylation domain-containing protein